MGAGARQFVFMLKGLQELQPRLAAAGIPFFLLQGDPVQTLPQLLQQTHAGLLVTDYAALRLGRQWRNQVRMGWELVVRTLCGSKSAGLV